MPIDPSKLGDDTAVDYLRKMHDKNIPKEEAFKYFKDNFGADPTTVPADKKLRDLLAPKAKLSTEGTLPFMESFIDSTQDKVPGKKVSPRNTPAVQAPEPVTMATAAGETTDAKATGEDATQPVEVWNRTKGIVRGAYDALSHPVDSALKGHEEAQLAAQMAIGSKSAASRTLDDLGSMAMGIPKMVGVLTEPLPRGTNEVGYGENIGKAVTEGAIGGTLHAVAHPVEAFQAGPISFASQIAPVLGAASKLSKAAGSTEKLAPVAEAVAKEMPALTRARQVLSDYRAQETPYASGVAEELSAAGKTQRASEVVIGGASDVIPIPAAKGEPAKFQTIPSRAPVEAAQADLLVPKIKPGPTVRELQETRVNKELSNMQVGALRKDAQDAVDAANAEVQRVEAEITRNAIPAQARRGIAPSREPEEVAAVEAAKAKVQAALDEQQKVNALPYTPEESHEGVPAVHLRHVVDLGPKKTADVGTVPAMVMTEERATQLAQELVGKSDANPESVRIAKDYLLDYYAKHPNAPQPLASSTGPYGIPKDFVTDIPAGPADVAKYQAKLAEAEKGKAADRVAADISQRNIAKDAYAVDQAKALYADFVKNGAPAILPGTREDLNILNTAIASLVGSPGVDTGKAAQLIQHVNALKEHMGQHVSPGVFRVLNPAEKVAHPVMDKVMSWVKQSLTSQNPSSAINNFVANYALQTARVGDPFTVGARLLDAANDLRKRRAGTLDPAKAKAFDFWERTGLLDSTALGHDVEAVAGTKLGNLNPIRNPLLDKAYKMGDNIFKADEAVSSLNKYQSYVDSLGAGKTLDLEISPNVVARFTGGAAEAELLAGGRTLRKVPAQEALYRAAAQQAQNLFMDYSVVPEAAQWVRNAGPLSVASPFSTYFLKAVDIPGLKKGLGYRIMEGPRPIVGTTDMGIAVQEAKRSLVTSAQRAATINGMRNALRDETDPALREAVSYAPTQVKLALVRQMANPKYMSVEKLGNWNYLGATELLARVAVQGYGATKQMLDRTFKDKDTLQVEDMQHVYQDREGKPSTQDIPRKYAEKYFAEDPDLQNLMFEARYAADPKEVEADIKEHLRVKDAAGLSKATALMKAKQAVDAMSPSEKAELRRGGEFMRRLNTTGYASMDDALNLIQLGGTPLTQALDKLSEAAAMGKTLDTAGLVMNTFAPLLLGGFTKNVVQVGAAAAWRNGVEDARPFSGEHLTGDKTLDALTRDDLLRFGIRKFTGVGWEALAADKIKGDDLRSFFGKAKQEWLGTLKARDQDIEDLRRRITSQKTLGNQQAVQDLQAELATRKHDAYVVDQEMRLFDDNLKLAMKAVAPTKSLNKPKAP
ncbi:hypothetical protein UFOVP777_16 [uncultured Caudovirales phage]|uniref:Large polyvalent protein associated domain-containing protein n=1 Tax=uncultured Caudovirales phage TaxID=2100421 RepID=A0A6J5NWL9_9CAUD|nr:hypothetical protein UFOVP777_16 [uncultured Caudovirales phage]